ncbi:unnamed protein product [Caenorhabditis brenneri]
MNSKSLSYDSLKTVLQHMDAHTRINLSSRIPSIRKTEKSVPFKIKSLTFDHDSISIDDTLYKVGIFRDYGASKPPNYVKKCNEEWGGRHDIDEYGFNDLNSLKQKLLPEDIIMKPNAIEEPPPRNDDTIKQKETEIVTLKSRILELDDKYKKYLSDHGFEAIEELAERLHTAQEQNDESRYETLYGVLENMRSTNSSIMSNLEGIDEIQYYLECYKCFRNKTSPPYKPYIQLTVVQWKEWDLWVHEYEVEHIEHVEYRKQLPLALKAISNFIFEGRRHPVHVETLRVGQTDIIRVPNNLQLKVRCMHLSGSLEVVCNALYPIIHGSSFPLKEFKIVDFSGALENHVIDINYLQSEMPRNAEKLDIEYYGDNDDIWLTILLALQNKSVSLNFSVSLSADDYIELIRTWAVQGKEIGTVFTFEVLRERRTQEIVDCIAGEFEGAVKDDRCITIPMSNHSSQIHVTTTDDFDFEFEYVRACFLEIKVVSSSDD